MELTVMTFNLRTNRAPDGENGWEYRCRQAAQMIRLHDPLLVGTQEGNLDMLDDLRHDEYGRVGEGRRGGGEDEHNAIFYKSKELEVLEHGTFWLSEQPETAASVSWDSSFPRICTWAHFRHKETGVQLVHFNTHLDHRGQQAREEGIRLIWSRIREYRSQNGLPVFLTGDFNAQPDNPAIRFMRGQSGAAEGAADMTDAYSTMEGPVGASFNDRYSGRTEGEPIDYIFVTPDVKVLSVQIDRRTIDGRYPSDHYPVVARLEITPNQ